MEGQFITLTTYGSVEDEVEFFTVPSNWLLEWVKSNWNTDSLEEFLNEYIWDTSLEIRFMAKEQGVLNIDKCPKYDLANKDEGLKAS